MSDDPIDFPSLLATYSFAPETQARLATLLDTAITSTTNHETANKAAADAIDELCPRNEDAEAFLWSLWELLIDIARRIPVNDNRIENLVEVVQILRYKKSGSVEIWGSSYDLWADMPLFGAVMREAWNDAPEFDDSPEQAAKIARWTALNSFAARLLGSAVRLWTNFALWELRDGLEEPPVNDQARDTHLITASEWIIHAGPVLCGAALDRARLDEHDTQSLRPGSLYEGGSAGFSRERWNFWVDRLDELRSAATDEEVKEEAQTAWEMIQSLVVGYMLSM